MPFMAFPAGTVIGVSKDLQLKTAQLFQYYV